MSEPLPDDLLDREARRTDQVLLGLTRRSRPPVESGSPPAPAESPAESPDELPAALPAELVNGIPLDALSIADWSGFSDAPILEWPPKSAPVSDGSAQSEPSETPGFWGSFGWE